MTQIQSGPRLIADRYVLRSMIGRGGSGAVWRAEDRHLHRTVAIKQIVLSDQRSTRSRTRALREAQAVARLRTPGVVQVYDVHDDGAHVYLVMELIDAASLSRLVRRSGPFAPASVARIGRSILDTLTAVHAAGIVHRDVKPSNVLVTDDDTVHLTDFGIALFGDDPVLTASGSVLGTPAYMAPEQARGERVGPAADLYGLGATMYFALEGCAPFADVGSWETTRAVREEPHRPGNRLGPLEPIVEALLVKDPAARPDPASVAKALGGAATGIALHPPPRPDPPPDATAGAAMWPADDMPADTPTGGGPGGVLPTVPVDAERHQLRRALLWTAALLVLLTTALVLLFLAVRDHPEAPAAAVAVAVLQGP